MSRCPDDVCTGQSWTGKEQVSETPRRPGDFDHSVTSVVEAIRALPVATHSVSNGSGPARLERPVAKPELTVTKRTFDGLPSARDFGDTAEAEVADDPEAGSESDDEAGSEAEAEAG